jgi:hypothetical protein
MQKDDTYYFHQTPVELAKDLMQFIPLTETDRLLEPFRGEGAFYNHFPANNPKDWCEITDGRNYIDYNGEYDWVISNPPFKLDGETGRVNAFWKLLDFYTDKATKGVAFLGNDTCFGTLTPKRIAHLEAKGWSIQKVVVCSVKKWRGRYFFIIVEKKPVSFYTCLNKNY